MSRSFCFSLLMAVFVAVLSGCTHEPARSAEFHVEAPDGSFEYRIGPADVLQITVWKNEMLTRQVPVRPDGMISLPLVHEVRAAGLTPMQLRDTLKSKLATYVSNTDISVTVMEINSFTVSVLGEVRAAGRYQFSSHVTVLDVLARAGGITEFAASADIVVLRPEAGAMKKITFDYMKAVAAQERQNFFVQPGDIVIVP